MGDGAAFLVGTGVGAIVGVGGKVGIGAVIGVGTWVDACLPTVRRYANTDNTTLTITITTRITLIGFFNAPTRLRKVLTIINNLY